ncbi:MAG: UDP-4-amino-4,6-dideoxy-N-acetyl-beta-L-altrosamine N-acetyltransferase [Acidobacteria bacterium RIFCSPLOWO2_12_FULL_59_11]|nr:MAG: UDP-4-amino-4,6-dideoxy-N-acetyl-beta-L-altrosamine N-acetyltransferase [Acidobacteria bacterium RIFCSPLOWO2_12_FULL_59_11]
MIVGKRLQLRAIEADDLVLLIKWRNDPKVYQYFFEHEPLSLEMQRRWFETFLARGDEKLWIIEIAGEAKPIGTIGLVHIDWRNRKTEIGRILIYGEEQRGRGYGSEAEWLVLRYAFDHMNLNRICCEVYADNERGIQIHKIFGFKEEGRFREHIFRDGEYREVVYLALLRSEYLLEKEAMIAKYE